MISLPVLGVSFPANAQAAFGDVLNIATFDIPGLNMLGLFGDLFWKYGNDSNTMLQNIQHNELLYNNLNE